MLLFSVQPSYAARPFQVSLTPRWALDDERQQQPFANQIRNRCRLRWKDEASDWMSVRCIGALTLSIVTPPPQPLQLASNRCCHKAVWKATLHAVHPKKHIMVKQHPRTQKDWRRSWTTKMFASLKTEWRNDIAFRQFSRRRTWPAHSHSLWIKSSLYPSF